MKLDFFKTKAKPRVEGYALATVLFFTLVGFMVLAGAMNWSTTEIQTISRNNQYRINLAAAEAAHEKVMSYVLNDFKLGDLARISNNITQYPTYIPTTSENPLWGSFEFNNAQGSAGSTYFQQTEGRVYTNLPAPYVGLNGWRAVYKVVSNARQINNSRYTNIVAAVQQDIWLVAAPIFQFGIFYNGDLEINPSASLPVRGKVHCNGNIWIGSSHPTFYDPVSATGRITHTRHTNDPSYSSTLSNPTYNSSRTTNAATLTLPIGTNNTYDAVYEVIKRPPAGEDPNSNMGQERYYNKAELIVLISNNSVQMIAKKPRAQTNSSDCFFITTNISQWSTFMTTNKTFYDQREKKTMLTSEIDVLKLQNWSATNPQCQLALRAANVNGAAQLDRLGTYYITENPPVNLIYIADERSTNSTTNTCVRLVNGTSLAWGGNTLSYTPNIVGTNITYTTHRSTLANRGLTISTVNPLYVKGNYNCTNTAHLGINNTSSSQPCSLVSDALTIQSASWNDTTGASAFTSRDPSADMTVNAAVLTGIVPSTNYVSYYSGGVQNIFRMLEDWSGAGRSVTFNGSMVMLFASKRGTGKFVNTGQTGSYYSVPNPREIFFDTRYTDANNLPPGTPMYRDLLVDQWSALPPNTTNYVQVLY